MSAAQITVGTSHTLREAAHRMTRGQVGSAVVLDPALPGPGIITERDVLRCIGEGGDIDLALVGEYVARNVVYAAADWPLERAAEAMTAGGFRHLIVLDRSEVVGILSMRDIVRSWVETGSRVQATALAG
ncbi:MAG: CBS domain-containing protein [Solirubrobacteraceae bacterium]|jgi:CBS domain-containing protein